MDAQSRSQDEVTVLTGEDKPIQLESGQPSGEKLEPSTPSETFTKEQVDKLLGERHSKLDKRIAELEKVTAKSTKALELATKRASEAETILAKTLKEKEDAELESIQDNPDALSLYQAKQRIKGREAELSTREQEFEASKAEHEEALAELSTLKVTQVAQAIAAKYEGVDAGLLLQLTDKTPEKMELLASRLGTLKVTSPPDSGLSSGGAGRPTAEQLEAMSPEKYAEWASKRYK